MDLCLIIDTVCTKNISSVCVCGVEKGTFLNVCQSVNNNIFVSK